MARIEADQGAGLAVEGAAQALARCGELRPCAVERWVPAQTEAAAEGEVITLLRRGDRLERVDPAGAADLPGSARWRAEWTTVNGALAPCLGDLLADPPAGDPAGARELVEVGADPVQPVWRLHLSGHNRCALAGTLELSATEDRARPDDLWVDGLAWRQGGRQRAMERLRADLRAQALTDWEGLDAGEREEWLSVLERDPLAAALLEELRARPLAP